MKILVTVSRFFRKLSKSSTFHKWRAVCKKNDKANEIRQLSKKLS